MRFLISILVCLFSINTFADNKFSLSSDDFQNGGTLSTKYTCDGKDISPALSWNNAPDKTKAFALIISDPDAVDGTWYHWVVYNIPANVTKFDEDVSSFPKGTGIGKNSWGNSEYNGPCPPKGAAHTYIFGLYALDKTLSLPKKAKVSDVLDAIKQDTLKKAELKVMYSRWAG